MEVSEEDGHACYPSVVCGSEGRQPRRFGVSFAWAPTKAEATSQTGWPSFVARRVRGGALGADVCTYSTLLLSQPAMSEHSESLSAGPSRPGSPVGALPEGLPARPYRFNWDTARKPGPGSVISEYTDARGDFVQAHPRELVASSSTLSLPSEWTSSKYGFHGTHSHPGQA